MSKQTTILCILDGFGESNTKDYNAIALANTPNIDKMRQSYLQCFIEASEHFVGLPKGQMGNSEVGHVNIGAGRIVLQDLPRINEAFAKKQIAHNRAYQQCVSTLQQTKGVAHLVGMLSPGGVHGHQSHVIGLATQLANDGVEVYIHFIADGRDTPPKKIHDYYAAIKQDIAGNNHIHIASLQGRFFAMDRDNNWERTLQAFNLIVHGEAAQKVTSLEQAIDNAYAANESDEFIAPTLINTPPTITEKDSIILVNFRPDRMKQLAHILADKTFSESDRGQYAPPANLLAMKAYDTDIATVYGILFDDETPQNVLGDILAQHQYTQLRIAESEKYNHVTFFMNGGSSQKAKGEEHILIPSPKVKTYDMQPEMAAYEVTAEIANAIKASTYDVIIVNYANADMVGHTGNLEASIKAVEVLDDCLATLQQHILQHDGTLFITADHGNIECLFDTENGQKHTQHTMNKVPFITVCNKPYHLSQQGLQGGTLKDIAPTMLYHLGITQPPEMTGTPLIKL